MSSIFDTKTRPVKPAVKGSENWWQGATIYQIYPRSFYDSNHDGVGDLPGIVAKMDYVADLGVDAIWISPFFTSPMADFGYDVSNYRNVDPTFGTLQDFDHLIHRAHTLGLKVIIDQVYCHTSDQHAWYQQSQFDQTNDKSDWYVWAEAKPDGSPPNNWRSVFGGPAWTWNNRRSQYFLHHFLKEQPTLNMHNEAVVEALIDVGKFWIERGVDGFRLDALNMGMHDLDLRDNPQHPDSGSMGRPYDMQIQQYTMSLPGMEKVVARFSEAYRAAGGESFLTVAEIGGTDPFETMQAYTRGDRMLSSAYSFDFIGSKEPDPEHIRSTLKKWPNSSEAGYPAWALSNHDCPRVASRWQIPGTSHVDAVKLNVLLQFAVRGVVFLYQGEELGLPQAYVPFDRIVDPEAKANWPLDQGRDGARTPIPWESEKEQAGFSDVEPWLPVDPNHYPLAVSAQENDQDSSLNFFRKAIALRKSLDVLRLGDADFLDGQGSLVCLQRTYSGEKALCVLNLTREQIALPESAAGNWSIELQVGFQGTAFPRAMPAFSGLIAVQKP